MSRMRDVSHKSVLGWGLALAFFVPWAGHAANREAVLYSFKGGSDAANPAAGLIADSAGNLYGTTALGGNAGDGTVFEITADGTETILHSFGGGYDGSYPEGGLVADKSGNLYGTTPEGGVNGEGTVFRLAPGGDETILYAFKGGSNGSVPVGGLVMDAKGIFYGTTGYGGTSTCDGFEGGCGTVFRLTPDGKEKTLYIFQGGDDGEAPSGTMVYKNGIFYGTTYVGGGGTKCNWSLIGCGTVFKVTPSGAETVLYAFQGESDGGDPSGIVIDTAGNLYGAAAQSGKLTHDYPRGCGTVFMLAPNGTETTLYTFNGGTDGAEPYAALIADKNGSFYGTTSEGGRNSACSGHCGTVFEIDRHGNERVLYRFRHRPNGRQPEANLIADQVGNLYGTAYYGGITGDSCGKRGCGVVFKVAK